MTIIMSEKHQVTIPKKIAAVLGLKKGSLFKVKLTKGKIELIPVDLVEKTFSKEDYEKFDKLVAEQSGKEKKVTKQMIEKMKNGKW